jgi:hypothetical protein
MSFAPTIHSLIWLDCQKCLNMIRDTIHEINVTCTSPLSEPFPAAHNDALVEDNDIDLRTLQVLNYIKRFILRDNCILGNK